MIEQKFNMSLGLPCYVDSFLDEKPRLCTPFKLKDISHLYECLANIDEEILSNNFKEQFSSEYLKKLIEYCFLDESFELIVEQINDLNFSEIIRQIKIINGLDVEEATINNDNYTSNDWNVMVSQVMCHTSNTISDILQMTLPQFNHLIIAIHKNLNWEHKTLLHPHVQTDDFMNETDYPFYSPKTNSSEKRVMTIEDIKAFEQASK